MERDIDRKRAAMKKRYVASKRHTIQVDYEDYMRELAKEMEAGRAQRRGRGRSASQRCLPDEQDLRVLRQRPEVVGDDLLEPVGDLAHLRHRGQLVVAGVLGELQALDAVGVEVGRLELADPASSSSTSGLDLAVERAELGLVDDRAGSGPRPAGASSWRSTPPSPPRCWRGSCTARPRPRSATRARAWRAPCTLEGGAPCRRRAPRAARPGVVRRFFSPRCSASACHSSE